MKLGMTVQTCYFELKLAALDIFFYRHKTIIRKPGFRRPVVITSFFSFCELDSPSIQVFENFSPSVGSAVHFSLTLFAYTHCCVTRVSKFICRRFYPTNMHYLFFFKEVWLLLLLKTSYIFAVPIPDHCIVFCTNVLLSSFLSPTTSTCPL